MISKVVKRLFDYIEEGLPQKTAPLRTLNAVGSYPLAYRTFGGQTRGNGDLDDAVMERAFGSHYLLTMLCSGAVIRRILYREPESCHSLYCDGMTLRFLDRHGLAEHGVWDRLDHAALDENITMENVDHRIYYSAAKPFALLKEGEIAGERGIPVLFVDADLILKKRHDVLLRHPETIRAAYGHLEAVGTPCYPDFAGLHFPDGYRLPPYRTDLLAVNTCLMYFRDLELMAEWSCFFKDLFLDNWIGTKLDDITISRQLLGIDQRTFPMVADSHGYWENGQVEAFLDLVWDPPYFRHSRTGESREWHYYTLEHHPEHADWLQDITHTWINKRNIERDISYRNYQGCMMLEMILELEPGMEPYLTSFESLKPYFDLRKQYGTMEAMLLSGAVRDRLDKEC